MSVQVNCPHCLTPCEVPDHQADKVLSCGNCQKTFRLKIPAKTVPPTLPPAVAAAKPPEKPRVSDLAKAAKPAAVPPPAPKKAPAVDVLEVVEAVQEVKPAKPTLKKRAQPAADANPFRGLDNDDVAKRPVKKKRSRALVIMGCLGLLAFFFVGSAGVAAIGVWYLYPSSLATNNSDTVVQINQPGGDKAGGEKPNGTKPADKPADIPGDKKNGDKAGGDKPNGDKATDKPAGNPGDNIADKPSGDKPGAKTGDGPPLVMLNQPTTTAAKGKPYEHQVAVKSMKGGVKYKLDVAPPGMTISADGKITWTIPADFDKTETDVTLNVSDASGQEITHAFKIAVAAPAKPVTDITRGRFEIKAPVLKADKEERLLKAATDEVCLAGGGRFVLLSQPKDQRVAVFDVNEATVVQYLDIGEDLVKMTACMDKLFVAIPAKGMIQRWNLRTFEKEVTQPLPFKGTLTEICMGHASRSPLVAVYKETEPGRGNIKYLDPDTLKPLDLEYADKTAIFAGRGVRASADGRVFAAAVDNQHVSTLQLTGKTARSRVLNAITNLGWPSVDGRTIFTATEGFNGPDFRTKLGLETATFPPVTLPFVPARQGDLFMRLDDHWTRDLMKNPKPANPSKEGGDVLYYLPGQKTPFATWKDFDGVFGQKLLAGGKSLTADERYILLPDAGVLITIPATNDRLVLYRFDLDDLLTKYGKDYLFIASTPLTVAAKGQTYTYQVVAKSKQPDVKYTLAKSPPGMKVTTEGKLTWEVPADFAADDAEVILHFSDKLNTTTVVHSFKITIEK